MSAVPYDDFTGAGPCQALSDLAKGQSARVVGVVPSGFPPVEGALFYDVGVVRDVGTHLRWSYAPGEENDPSFRAPLQTVGASLRINVLGFVIVRVDYSRPLHRPGVGGLWAVSLGPTF